MGALARTLWRNNFDEVKKTPSRRFYSNHLEAWGLLSGT